METRHSIEGSFGSEFTAIRNLCIVMAVCSRKTLKYCEKFLHFGEIRPLMVKFSKFSSESFHHDVDLKLLLLCRLHPKSARASPKQCTQIAPDFIHIRSLSAEL